MYVRCIYGIAYLRDSTLGSHSAQTLNRLTSAQNVTGFFTRPGSTAVPFIYHIRPMQDGAIFAVRSIEVTQKSNSGRSEQVCFTCTATFKREEADHLPVQEDLNLRQKYKAALGDKQPQDWPECPAVDSPWFWENLKEHGRENNPKFPGLHSTKVDMVPYNASLHPLDRRQLQYYAIIGPERMPSIRQDPNLHAAAHLYASDRNSLFALTNLLDIGDDYMQMASLSHTVIFHTNPDQLSTLTAEASWGARAVASERGALSEKVKNKWFCEEAWVTRNGVGRCLRESKIWDDKGVHIATSMQDGLVRLGPGVSRGERMREDFEKNQKERESETREKANL